MANVAHPVELNLPEKLRDREYRQKFFLAELSAQIASQLIALRKRRGLNQQQVAELTGTQQPAISRIEKADYQSWSFNVLRKIAGILDARLRVLIEPSEDVIAEYGSEKEEKEETAPTEFDMANALAILSAPVLATPQCLFVGNPVGYSVQNPLLVPYTGANTNLGMLLSHARNVYVSNPEIEGLRAELAAKEAEIAKKNRQI